MKRLLLLFALVVMTSAFAAQALTVKGTVVDDANEPLPGVSIKVLNTTHGAITDIDGAFVINNVEPNATLQVSYIGYTTIDVPVNGRDEINITLKEDVAKLDEVVVIGYGTAQAKDLTAPIAVIKGEELSNIPTTSPMAAIQGKVPGVTILNSGTPGAGPKVRIRGTGSFGSAEPLYVVDGMFYDNIDFLNNDDIQDMSILKDASAAAIYGVKAANGVVIITTKKGRHNEAAHISYNGYVGVQTVTKRLKMANAHEYATMLQEANPTAYNPIIENAINTFGGNFNNLTFGADTDWYGELLRDAVMTNHSLNIAGGSERATYSLGLSYLYQDGIMNTDNNYNRLNFRAQIDYDATSWLKVGFSGVFSQSKQQLPNNKAWEVAFNAPQFFPVYDDRRGDDVFPVKYASPDQFGVTNNLYNPVATANYYNSRNNTNQYLTNFYAQFNLLPDKLNFKTSFGKDYSTVKGRTFTEPYYVGVNQQATNSSLSKTVTTYDNWSWDNVLTYKDKFGKHGVGAMVGYSMRQDSYSMLNGSVSEVPTGKEEYWYIVNGNKETATSSDGGSRYRSQSVFTRLNYDYAGKYLVMFTFRADGTSKYQEKWGYFPSIGGAWVITSEDFMENQKAFDYMKLRASWGKLGNDNVAASDGFASVATGLGTSGVFGNVTYPGFQNTTYYSWLKWEVVTETTVGLQFTTLGNRLDVDIDWFNRTTNNAVISPLLPFENRTLAGNYGTIENMGADIQATWSDRVGEFKYYVTANGSILRNRVKSLGGKSIIKGGETANIVGEKMNSFYGYKVVGIYQNQAQIDASPIAKAYGLQPGDLIYEDVNNDGQLDGEDQMALGSYIPDFTYGISLGFSYKNFDFSLSTLGTVGSKLYNRKRALHYQSAYYNFDHAQFADRWHGEGTSNTNPSSAALMSSYTTQNTNSYYVESADYFRFQNIALGYTFKNIKMGNYKLPSLRMSLNADRPFSFFKAHSFTPELSDAQGWDTEVYPLASTFTFGLQIDF
ncbi:MAG: TonB-dependent receptor [Muribaculaceae bacterium]|nr:TonB-dependent receptor [Muribaculaceae bacterium]